ncbi:conserved hypothetical protein [Desulfatibacillum aliphaticivorans]|uniref:Uncharacterized protein n=1 Tax=Desulfatibacillum aliphaticivorans TaxID=218208 RepID=B8FMZ4_DESAL|nr:hypothetical protein [Desulfatibacillum aliphaticivorans]ACL05864.1 conserved hypothetical protein [Desulfatibacillum aliphaticivorans]
MKISILRKNGHEVVDLNRRKAIRERCLNCSGWVRSDVTHCDIPHCHLYPYRMGAGPQNAKEREKAIRRYCLECMGGQRAEIAKCTCPDCSLYPYRMSQVDRSVEIQS